MQGRLFFQSHAPQPGRGFVIALGRSFGRASGQLRRSRLGALGLGGIFDSNLVAISFQEEWPGQEAKAGRELRGQLEWVRMLRMSLALKGKQSPQGGVSGAVSEGGR